MPYQVFVAVALVIHVLTNIDMFTKKEHIAAIKPYRLFLISIAAFYAVDILWGIFDEYKLATALYIDTLVYFILMGLTIMFWTYFVIRYLEGNRIFNRILFGIGVAFFAAEVVLLIVNIFQPILFSVDENAVYAAYPARDIMLYAQIAMYSLLTVYAVIHTLVAARRNFRRYLAIILFSVVMIVCIAIQLGDPYIPFYSIGCLVGVAVLDSFSLIDRKERIQADLEKTSEVKEEKEHELDKVITIAYHDSLTGVRSRYSFVEKEERIDAEISQQKIEDFAVVVFDINGLKATNDKYGHQEGDRLIVSSVEIISSIFPRESIYRYGGDEFVVILEGNDAESVIQKHDEFLKAIDANLGANKPIVASGVSRYRPESDFSFKTVFSRADKMMYARKEHLKDRGA